MSNEVRTIEAAGRARGFKISYWEVQNEPFSGNYYSAEPNPAVPITLGGAGETVADFEAQYLAAYRGIKTADPHAKWWRRRLGPGRRHRPRRAPSRPAASTCAASWTLP